MVFTIGHSTHPIAEFLSILKAYGIETLVDVRTIPRSRHNPQFATEALAASLAAVHIGYVHRKALGGLRHARKDSMNMGWRNTSFRGYADYMQTEEFAQALGELVTLSQQSTVAIMCAEAVPWRCHRSLIADALLVRGIPVTDIFSVEKSTPHCLTSFAQVEDGRITYPGAQLSLPELR